MLVSSFSNCFHCGFYEGGLFHIFTPYGMYAPDGQEFEEFIRNNNCLILSVEDKKDDEAVSEGKNSSSASVNDTAKIEEQIEPEPEAVEDKPDASTSASVSFKPFVIEIGFDIRESNIDAEFIHINPLQKAAVGEGFCVDFPIPQKNTL